MCLGAHPATQGLLPRDAALCPGPQPHAALAHSRPRGYFVAPVESLQGSDSLLAAFHRQGSKVSCLARAAGAGGAHSFLPLTCPPRPSLRAPRYLHSARMPLERLFPGLPGCFPCASSDRMCFQTAPGTLLGSPCLSVSWESPKACSDGTALFPYLGVRGQFRDPYAVLVPGMA